jgi:signal transduction histidine kinase
MQGQPLGNVVPEIRLSVPNVPGRANGESDNSGLAAWEFTSRSRDGGRIHIQASCASFKADGRDLLVLSARDVTQLRREEQQLRGAQQMEAMGRLVGGVAHDFNNLLTGIQLYCDLLLAGLHPSSRLRHQGEEIRMASEHGSALIQQLLGVARPRAIKPRAISLNQVISGMRNLLTRLIGENIELESDLSPDLGRVRMDAAQVQQIVMNLALNARDAMPEGGRVTLATRNCAARIAPTQGRKLRPPLWVELTVSDTGCGMDAETRAHLFEPFFTTKRAQGNGLGLATVCRIVEQSAGTMEIESNPGQGTRVIVRLPRVKAAAEDSALSARPDAQKRQRFQPDRPSVSEKKKR